jgi:peptidyl-prolyl cis-trans isomerase C
MRLRVLLLVAAVSVILALGCSKERDMDESSGGPGSVGGSSGRGIMVVTVNGREVYEDEIAKEIDRIKSQLSGRVSVEQLDGMSTVIRQQAINNMISRVLLEQAANRDNVEVTDKEIEERSDQIKSGFGSDEIFLEQLQTSGLTEAGFKQEVELAMRIETLLEKKTAGIDTASNSELREFYDANIDRFKRPERAKASHILIPIADTDGDAEKAEKRQKLEDILSQVKNGADFAELAKEHSSCPSKTRGGDLGFFGRGQMVKEFEDAAFGLDVGAVSDIVETRFGYHIILCTDQQPASTISFDDARADIKAYLEGEKRQQAVTSYIDSLRSSAAIVYPDTSSTN